MEEPDLSAWLQDWRHAARIDSALGPDSMDPLVLPIDDDNWVVLSATTAPGVLRLDMVLEADLPDEVIPWLVRQILHWTFDHPYAETALQFALAPDATLAVYTHLSVSPEDGAAGVMDNVHAARDQAEDAWGQILVDALLKAHLEERVPVGEPSTLAA